MKTLKLGMIGSGFITHFHAQAIEYVREMEISAVYSLDLEGCEKLANFCQEKKIGTVKICQSVTEVCENCEVVAIYSPNFTRVAVMEEIAKAVKKGCRLKGLICEKPFGRNLIEAKRILQLAKKTKLPTAYFENQIFMKAIQVQREQLHKVAKTMGPLALVRSAEEHSGPHSPWFWDPTQQGGGVLSDMGCHSVAVSWYCLTPLDKPLTYLVPQSCSCDLGLLKWGTPKFQKKLLKYKGVDYSKTPAEDFATGIITFKNPKTGQLVKAQFTNSWMYDKQGLRLSMDGLGPGHAFEINSLISPLSVFIGDEAAESILDQESALEKSTASRGLLAVQPNEADLYGYIDENKDAALAFLKGKDATLNFEYGYEITKLIMAAYLAHEKRKTLDLTDKNVLKALETYIPLIQKGQGAKVLKI
jgi:predicted dehydrogenase